MNGKYPTGGYRNSQARELSRPSQSGTPQVASPVSGPASLQVAPLKGELMIPERPRYKVERLSDMGTKTGLKPGVVHLDRMDHIADSMLGGELDWQQREKFRMKHSIDLGAGDYRIDGRGRAMRAAIKLARSIVRGGKRLPKNVWKELILTLLDMILSNLPRDLNAEFPSGVMATPDGWIFRSYGALEYGAGVPFELASGAVHGGSAPGVGKMKWGNQVYDPLNRGTSSAPAYLAAIGGQALGTNPPSWNKAGLFIQTNTVPRYSHVATYLKINQQSLNPPFAINEAKTTTAISTGTVSFTSPYSSVRSASGNGTPTPTRVAVKQKDHKMKAPAWMAGPLNVAYHATELGDFVDCMYKALPKWERYGRSYTDKMGRIYAAFDQVDWTKAAECWMWNAATDPLFGRGFGALDKHFQGTSINGMSYQYGVTYGGGSSSFINVSF